MLDLIPVLFGNEETTARPYEFIHNDDGDLVAPIKAITICTHCGHSVDVDLTLYKGTPSLKCDNCGFGNGIVDEECEEPLYSQPVVVERIDTEAASIDDLQQEMLEALQDDEEDEKIVPKIDSSVTVDESTGMLTTSCVFVDPIELGLFEIEEL